MKAALDRLSDSLISKHNVENNALRETFARAQSAYSEIEQEFKTAHSSIILVNSGLRERCLVLEKENKEFSEKGKALAVLNDDLEQKQQELHQIVKQLNSIVKEKDAVLREKDVKLQEICSFHNEAAAEFEVCFLI